MAYIPGEIKLFSQAWTIRPGTDKELTANHGMCYPDSCEIIFNAHQTWDNILHTVMHELIHAIETKTQLNMTEAQVDVLALCLIHLFRTNPDLLELFNEK